MTTNKDDRKEGRSANIGFAKWRVQCFYDSLVQASSSVFQMSVCAENPPLRKAAKRYRKPYGDSTNIKQTDMNRTFLDNITERLTARPTSQDNDVLFFSTAHFLFLNFNATSHCTHLPLLACTHTDPKAKSKECNFQRTKSYI
jgi:hypothetical protein